MSYERKPVVNFGSASATSAISSGNAYAGPNSTIHGIIYDLRSAFKPSDYDRVEQVLISREESLKKTLKEVSTDRANRKRDYESIEKKHGELVLVNLEIEAELKKYKRSFLDIEDELNKCKQDCGAYSDRERKAEEKYKMLLEDFKKAEEKYADLKREKSKVEDEVEYWKNRRLDDEKVYSDREKRAEERYVMLKEVFTKSENDKKEIILELNEKCADLKREKSKAEAEVEYWKNLFEDLKPRVLQLEEDTAMLLTADPVLKRKIEQELAGEVPVSDGMMGEKVISGYEKPRRQIAIGIDNTELVQPQAKESILNCQEKADSTCNSPVVDELPGSQEADQHSFDMPCGNGGAISQQLVFDAGSSTKAMGSSMARNWRPQVGDIIEIDDSDGEDIERSCKNCLPASMHKRKRASRSNRIEFDSDDDNIPSGKRGMKNLQDLGHRPKASPFNHCLIAPTSFGTNVATAVPPPSHNPVLIKHFEEKANGKCNSRIPSISSDSDDSSDSGDENGSPSYMNDILANIRRKNKVWAFKADMLAAFERDPELCMNAVCALYRQQTSKEKSSKNPVYFSNRGFSQFDALRGSSLAEFLIDGDRQGKLRKSVSELQQSGPKALDDCRNLANQNSDQLFEIYQKKEDPFFPPPQYKGATDSKL